MANRWVSVNLAFTADATAAKRQIQDLQKQLSQLASSGFNNGSLGLSDEIENAISLVTQLKAQLANATNASTGKLDLERFNQSLKQSGVQLKDYKSALVSLGPDGQKAFSNLASAITKADLPIKRTSDLLSNMLVTLKNTAKWELSSKLMHGFESAVSSAYSYTQNLNKSLNDIRIVTGYNVDQMTEFAEQANKAAKALSTTTTDYTNASLIYYQQGLTDEEVLARTDVTIKMANAAGESATKVSDQLTAVWNNFYDGSKSLEYYADVMTKLGAATASSTDEIAEGLEKFAAIADTVGLSYEYATAALATVTSNTRQSADVVGTAFKTIFARMQDLELGDTLDDGTTLGSYSEALAKVGVNVLDTNGNLVEMDDLLDAIATKWEGLSKAQQVSLAQSVAGVRQYTQLVALMDNWDAGDADSMVANLGYVSGAEGSLQEQADIYAESWEASKDRVTAALESIYSSLIDEDFFIGFNNVLEWILGQVNALIKSLGGVPGVLSIIGATVSNVFSKQLETSLDNFVYNLRFSLGVVKKEAENLRTEASSLLNTTDVNSTSGIASDKAYLEQQVAQQLYIENAERLNGIEQATAQSLLQQHEARVQNVIAQGEIVEKAEQEAIRVRAMTEAWAKRQINGSNLNGEDREKAVQQLEAELDRAKNLEEVFYRLSAIPITNEENLNPAAFEKVKSILKDVEKEFGKIEANNQALGKGIGGKAAHALAELNAEVEKGTVSMETFVGVYDILGDSDQTRIDNLARIFTNLGVSEDEARERAEGLVNAYAVLGNESAKLTEEQQALVNSTNHLEKFLKNAKGQTQSFSFVISASVSAFSSLAMSINSIKGMIDTLNDTDLSGFEKFLTITMQMGFVLPNLISSVQKLTQVFGPSGYIGSLITANAILGEHTAEVTKNTTAEMASQLAKKWANSEAEEQAIKTAILTKAKHEEAKATNAETLAEVKNLAVKAIKNPVLLVAVAAIAAITAALYLSVKAYNADSEAAERAAEASKKMAEEAEDAKDKAESLKSAIEGYDSAVATLNDCVKGTQEWRDAFKEVQEAAINVLNTTNGLSAETVQGLAGAIQSGDQEQISKAMEAAQNEADLVAQNASYATSSASYEASEAQLGSDARNLARQMDGYTYNASTETTQSSGFIKQIILDNLDELGEAMTASEFGEKLKEFGVDLNYVSDNTLASWQSSVQDMAASADTASAKLNAIASIQVENALINSDYGDTEKAYATEVLDARTKELADDYYARMTGAGINKASSSNNTIYQEMLGKLQEAGYDVSAQTSNAVRGTDNNRSLAFLNSEGEEVVYNAEQIASMIAAAEALEEIGESAEKAAQLINDYSGDTLDNVSEVITAFDQETKEFDLGELASSLTESEIDAVNEAIDALGEDASDADKAQAIADALGITNLDEILATFGVEDSGAQFAQAWVDGANNVLDSFTQEELLNLNNSNINTSNASIGEQKAFAKAKQNAGQALIDQTDNGINFRELRDIENENTGSINELTDFYNALSQINVTSENATEQVRALVDEYGLEGDAVESLVNQVDELPKTFDVSTQAINEQAKALNEIADDIEIGDVVDQEDIDTLQKAGIDTSKYFTMMADGSYALTGAAEEFKQIVKSITFDDLKEQALDFDRAKQQVATGQFYDKYLTDTGVIEGAFTANAGGGGYISGSADDLGRARLDYINQFDANSFDFNEDQQQLLSDYQDDSNLELDTDKLQMIADMIDIVNQKEADLEAQLFTTATTLAQLDEAVQALGTYDYNAYADGLINVASQYENCADEIEEYQKVLLTSDIAQIKAAEDNLRAATVIGEAAEKYDLKSDVLEAQTKRIAKEYGISAEAAANLAVKNQRMNKGVSSLVDNWSDWKKQLSSSNKLTQDYAEAVVDCTAAIADLVGASEDLELPDEFFNAENMALVEQAINGDTDAINKLGAAVGESIVETLAWNEGYANLISELEEFNGLDLSNIPNLSDILGAEQFETDKETVLQGIRDIKNGLIESGDGMTDDWVAALNRMALTTGMSVDEMNSLLGSIGVQAKVETTYVKQPMEVPTYTEEVQDITWKEIPETWTDANGEEHTSTRKVAQFRKATVPGEPVTVEGYAAVAQISTEDNPLSIDVNESTVKGNPPNSSASYSSNRGTVSQSALSGSGSKSGGSSSKKPAEHKNESEVLDRYKEITDSLDDVTRATNKASKAADRLYGKSRIDAMKQANASLQQEIDLLKQKKTEAEDYLKTDRLALDKAASDAGVSFAYDAEGNITNYTDQMRNLLNQYNTLVDQANADGDVSDAEQEKLDALSDLIDKLKDAISQYDDTRELLQDLDEEITDKFYEWQDNNYEILHYELEIEIEINDLELEYIDYYLNKIADDFYALAEAAEYVVKKMPNVENELGSYRDLYYQLNEAYRNGEVSKDKYIEGLKESYNGILDQLGALNDLDKEMLHYYEDTLEAASEELSKYTDRMEHLNSVLTYYKNLIELINGEFDYKSISKILEAQAKTLKNELDVATANYKMLQEQKREIEQSLRDAQDDAARELFQEELDAINAAIDEAQENMLSKTEEWAEAQKAIMENAMAEAAAEMEKAFTDGMGFDALSDSLGRLSSYADEYLTKTNQIYETQKLMNTVQQAIDKTTNEAAKTRLKNYNDEIKQLQEKNQMSNLELEIAKAKYEVLLAEIALEEAQNAKATVRLQRDSEGNYGYVYTADQDAISDAEADLLDAQNRLYNIGLDGTNEYGQKLLELQQQLSDDLIALEEARAAGQYETDAEYYAARDQLISEYNNLFRVYSEQYTIAMGVDAAIQEEAWINAYESMILKTEDWQEATTLYTGLCEDAYSSWREVVETESEIIDAVLNDLESEVNDITEASDNLRDEVVNDVIPAMKDELYSVLNVTAAYAEQRSEIQDLISYYEALAQSIRDVIQEQSGLSEDGIDYSKDYSLLMNEAMLAGDMVAYNQYKRLRDQKIAAGYDDFGIDTDVLDEYLRKTGGIIDDNIDWRKILGLNTGGYTGEWGPQGRLALLHEKELVLNQDDTSNFLSATQMLRDVVKMIDLKALREQVSILPYQPGAQLQNVDNSSVEQNVRIEASFPNVQDRNEIQEAFNNLINTASQYANRK